MGWEGVGWGKNSSHAILKSIRHFSGVLCTGNLIVQSSESDNFGIFILISPRHLADKWISTPSQCLQGNALKHCAHIAIIAKIAFILTIILKV